MEKISAIIITKNEEKNIRRCLSSLEGIVDEVIVIDSFSSDNTEAICKEYQVNFIEREFIDYSNAKNYGNSLAQNPLILSIDADEAISDTLKTSILNIKEDSAVDGYFCHRLTNYCGAWIHHCGWYPDTKMRLWRKGKAKWEGEIHEQLIFTGNQSTTLPGDLLHYSFPSIDVHAKKVNYFTSLAANDLFKRGKKASIFKILVSPIFVFLKKFIVQKGFLDGFYGFVISMMSAYYVFYKYAKLKELWIRSKHKKQ